MTNYPLTLLGALAYLAFLLFVLAIRIGRDPAPYRKFARLHLIFAGVYGIAAFAWVKSHPALAFDWEDALLGLYLYFALQYALVTHLFATVLRGFSIEICLAIHRAGGRASLSAIQSGFRNGRGIDFIKAERIAVLLESNALAEKEGKLTVTPFGRFAANLNRILLKIWNLRYLGLGNPAVRS